MTSFGLHIAFHIDLNYILNIASGKFHKKSTKTGFKPIGSSRSRQRLLKLTFCSWADLSHFVFLGHIYKTSSGLCTRCQE